MTSILSPAAPGERRPWYRPSLTTQIMIGLVVGGFIGWIQPEWGNKVYFLRDIFLNLIKSIIGPLVFSTTRRRHRRRRRLSKKSAAWERRR